MCPQQATKQGKIQAKSLELKIKIVSEKSQAVEIVCK
jgi:hypothetical protein